MIPELAADWESGVASSPYWEAAGRHRLELPRCRSCGRVQHPARSACESCGSSQLAYERSEGRGAVYSFTIVERALIPALRPIVPYVLALVDLDVGPRLLTVIRGCPPGDVSVGLRVDVAFEEISDRLTLPVFRPDGTPAP